MKLKDVVTLLDPLETVSVAGKGMRGVFYIGQALNIPERTDLMNLDLIRIGRELVWGENRICLRVHVPGGAS